MNSKESLLRNTNNVMNAGVVISLISTIIVSLISKYEVIAPFIYIALTIVVVGWLLIVFDKFTFGAILLCIGSVFFLPIGAISIVGVFKKKNEFKVNQFIQNEYGSN